MPSLLVSQIIEQLLPSVVVSSAAHSLITCPESGRLGFLCLPADPNGYADVARIVLDTTGGVPTVLAHDLNGQQPQAVAHAMDAACCTVQLVLAALCLPSMADGDGAASLAAFATRQWGTRIVQRAHEVAILGRMLHARRGHRTVLCAPLGLRIGIAPGLHHVQDYHAATVRTQRQRAPRVIILAQEGGSRY